MAFEREIPPNFADRYRDRVLGSTLGKDQHFKTSVMSGPGAGAIAPPRPKKEKRRYVRRKP